MTDRTTVRNPNTGRADTTIATSIYQPVREAILAAVDAAGADGLAFGELSAAVERRTDPMLWAKASVGWYTITVKLDLEARGLIEKVPGRRPQRLVLSPRAQRA